VRSPELPSLRTAVAAFHAWLTAPTDRHVAALFRMLVGGLVVVNLVATAPSAELYWSEHGLLPRATSRLFVDGWTRSLFDWLEPSDRTLWLCWSALVLQAGLLAAGLFTRFQAACVFVLLVSFQHRNGIICDAEDGLFRLFSLFLVFMPAAGDVWSVDAWIRRRRRRPEPPPRPAWALRLVQFQVCLVMFSAGLHKLDGASWRDGTAVHYVLHLDDWAFHWPLPQLLRESLAFSRLASWGTLAIELVAPILIWFKETRRWVLGALLAFHLSLEYSMNLFLFQWIMLAGWLTHATPADRDWLQRRWRAWRDRHPPPSRASSTA
jgi:hypothetical protein